MENGTYAQASQAAWSIHDLGVSYLAPKINAEPKNEDAKEGAYNRDFTGRHGGHKKIFPSFESPAQKTLSEVILRKARVHGGLGAQQLCEVRAVSWLVSRESMTKP
jgi:hypothetical protein